MALLRHQLQRHQQLVQLQDGFTAGALDGFAAWPLAAGASTAAALDAFAESAVVSTFPPIASAASTRSFSTPKHLPCFTSWTHFFLFCPPPVLDL